MRGDEGAADVAVSVELTEANLAELIAGSPVTKFIAAVPQEGLDLDIEVVVYPPDPRNPTGSRS